jgi:hypothetical protein
VQLLERTAKSVRLTDAGRAFLDEARAILKHTNEAVLKARAIGGKRETELQCAKIANLAAITLRVPTVLPHRRCSLETVSGPARDRLNPVLHRAGAVPQNDHSNGVTHDGQNSTNKGHCAPNYQPWRRIFYGGRDRLDVDQGHG